MANTLGASPPPINQAVIDPKTNRLTSAWIDYFNRLPLTLARSIERANSANLSTQGAAITATDVSGGGLTAGLYRVTYYARITRAATTSSSLTVTLEWTDGGVGMSTSGAAITGNTTFQSGTVLVRIDNAKAINYSTAYASVGATAMQYSLDVVVEKVDA